MIDSILTSTKKKLNLEEEYTEFDEEIIDHINSVFAILAQIGVGPELGFRIEDKTALWSTFLGGDDPQLNDIKTYMYLKVRMWFDPPTTGILMGAMEKNIEELEVRISILRESRFWINPNPVDITIEDEVLILDGGHA